MFEPFKKSEDNFIINKNIKILKRLWGKFYFIFIGIKGIVLLP